MERTCELVLGGRFFRVATRSVSEVEVHEDTGLFSFDRQAGTLMLREFHNEGYVITYRQVPSDGDVLTFESDHIENPDPTALKARISMRHAGDELRETLELASGGGDFRVCVNLRLTRR